MKSVSENTKTIKLNDYAFHYTEAGNGVPVIFVHGSIDDYRSWKNQTEVFKKKFRVITYSRRYHYPNLLSSASAYSVEQHSTDLSNFIKKLSLAPVILVGSSYGAYTCLDVAMKNPKMVKSLVMNEPPIIRLIVSDENNPVSILKFVLKDFSSGKSFLKFGMKALNPAKNQLKKGNLEEAVRLFANGVLGEGGYENLPEKAKQKLQDNAVALKEEISGPGFSDFPEEKASAMKVPVLLVYGDESPKFFHAISDKLHGLLPVSEKAVIRDASHDAHLANSSMYNEKVLEFISRHN
jgi:non-heme chloroperoxidase